MAMNKATAVVAPLKLSRIYIERWIIGHRALAHHATPGTIGRTVDSDVQVGLDIFDQKNRLYLLYYSQFTK
jgi:hypothetical protein